MLVTYLLRNFTENSVRTSTDDALDAALQAWENMEKRYNLYIAIPLDKVNLDELPSRNWYNQLELSSQYLLYSLRLDQYSYQPASGVVNVKYKVHIVTSQEDFIAYIQACELNVDLGELFNDSDSDQIQGQV